MVNRASALFRSYGSVPPPWWLVSSHHVTFASLRQFMGAVTFLIMPFSPSILVGIVCLLCYAAARDWSGSERTSKIAHVAAFQQQKRVRSIEFLSKYTTEKTASGNPCRRAVAMALWEDHRCWLGVSTGLLSVFVRLLSFFTMHCYVYKVAAPAEMAKTSFAFLASIGNKLDIRSISLC